MDKVLTEISCEIDRGALRVRGSVYIPKYELGFAEYQVFNVLCNIGVEAYVASLRKKYLHELDAYMDKQHIEVKQQVLEATSARISNIFGL